MKFEARFQRIAAKARSVLKRSKSGKKDTCESKESIEAVKDPGLECEKIEVVLTPAPPSKEKPEPELESVTVSEVTTSTAPSCVTNDETDSDLSSNTSSEKAQNRKGKVVRGSDTSSERTVDSNESCKTSVDEKDCKSAGTTPAVRTSTLVRAKSGVSDYTDSGIESDGSLVSRRTIPESIAAMQIKRIRARNNSTDSAFTEISEVDSCINYNTIIPDLKNLLIRADSMSSCSGSSNALPPVGVEDMWTSRSLPLANLRGRGKEPVTPASSCPSTSRSTKVVRHVLSRVQLGGNKGANEEVVLRAIRRLFSNDPLKQRSGVQMMQQLFGKEVGLLVVSIVALYARSQA